MSTQQQHPSSPALRVGAISTSASTPAPSTPPSDASSPTLSKPPTFPTLPPTPPVSKSQNVSPWRRFLSLLSYVPPRCRWDPAKPPVFSMSMNILFAFAAGFTVANLYYSHPVLNVLAHDFGVEYERVAQIPTVMQAGYAAGLLFLCPLGDLVPRRGVVVGLVGGTATLWYVFFFLFFIRVLEVGWFVWGNYVLRKWTKE